jgi:hypothetical protein
VPAGGLSEDKPVRVSLAQQNKIRWRSNQQLLHVVFPDEMFPVLPDGTRIAAPPFTRMEHASERWFVECDGDACWTAEINPQLKPLLKQVPNHQLEYRYRAVASTTTVYSSVIIQE